MTSVQSHNIFQSMLNAYAAVLIANGAIDWDTVFGAKTIIPSRMWDGIVIGESTVMFYIWIL
ncbi:hypothetical protein [Pseudanabaena minima]|uniref:hypothetical protein n=1 Tax=Pseudanabaena minima TaxID=890415 RepID=UPI003DA83BF9